MTLSHAEIEELLGAYVCDAVDADERTVVERHLPTCPKCRAEVAELREVTALLANSDAATPVPAGVWDHIVSSLDEAPPPLRLSVVPAPVDASPAPANVVPIAARRTRRRLAAVAAAAAVVVAVLGFSLGRVSDSSTSQPGTLQAAAYQALVEPGSRKAELYDDAKVQQGVAVVRSNGEGYLIGDDLPALHDRIYQLWGATADGTVISLGVLDEPGVIAFSVGDPAAVSALMLTEEIRPVDHSSNPPVVKGTLV
jgi:anti-sigma-K factor RskA